MPSDLYKGLHGASKFLTGRNKYDTWPFTAHGTLLAARLDQVINSSIDQERRARFTTRGHIVEGKPLADAADKQEL
jgi:hypothetical protein